MPSPILLWRNGFCNLFIWLAVETVFERDSSSKIGSKSHRAHFCLTCSRWDTSVLGIFLNSSVERDGTCGRSLFIRLRVVIHDTLESLRNRSWIPVKCPLWESTFLQHLFHAFQATRHSFCSSVLPYRAPWQRLFLDHVVRDRERIQSQFVKLSSGFAFNTQNCPQMQYTIPWLQERRQWEYCTFGKVSQQLE